MKFVSPRALIALVTLCTLPLFASAADVTVNVRDAASQKPLSGAKVTVGGGKSKQDFYTADDGSIKVPVANPRQLSLTAASDGYAPLQQYYNQRGPSDAMPDHFDFSLEHAISVSGTVVDQNNTPLAGAKVQCVINKKLSNPNLRLAASWTTVTADAMGNWSVAGIPETFDDIELGAYHRDCIGENPYFALDPFKDVAALKNGTATLKLFRGTPVTITVTDENGTPVRNATIGYGEDRVASNVIPTEKTNSKGVCTLGIKAGLTAALTIQAKGFSPELQRILIGDQPQAIAIKLEAGHLLEGNVLDEKGDPANKATVYIDTWRGARTLNKRLTTDVDGHFTWPEAPADEVKADVLTSHGVKRGVAMKAGDENKAAITPPTPFKGTVVDAATGQPVTNFSVALGISFQTDQPINWEYSDMNREVHQNGATFDILFSEPYPGRVVRVIADGYLPSDSSVFATEGKPVDFTFKLEKGQPITGKLLNPDDSPVTNTQVVLVPAGGNLQISGGSLPDWALRNAIATKVGPDGAFSLPSQRDDYLIVAVTDAGYAQVSRADFEKKNTLTLQPWSRLEGTAKRGTKPAADVTLQGTAQDQNYNQKAPHVYFNYSAKSDNNGNFAFDHVAPGKIGVGIQERSGTRFYTTYNMEIVDVAPGTTAHVTLGGKGRPVTGRVVVPADIAAKGYVFSFSNIQSARSTTMPRVPLDYLLLPVDQRKVWFDKWRASDEGKKFDEEQKKNLDEQRRNRPIAFSVKPDGTFTAEGVTEGDYTLFVNISATSNTQMYGNTVAAANTRFTMPAIPGGVSDDPLDVGTLTASPAFSGTRGGTAPPLDLKTLSGDSWKMADQKDKVVFVYVWSPKTPLSDSLNAQLKSVWDALGKNDRFAMIGLAILADQPATSAYATAHQMSWPLAALSDDDAQKIGAQFITKDFPASALFGTDGKLIAQNLAPEKILPTVQSALAPKPVPTTPTPAKPSKAATTIDPNDKLP